MSRILFAWELGLNSGHLVRILPVAQELKRRGHGVLVAARDTGSAASILGPFDIGFVQSPITLDIYQLGHRPAGYADILLTQGWNNLELLSGLVSAWRNLFRIYQPDRLVADFAPTACLAARLTGLPVVLLGNGFEMPPLEIPLPPFRGFAWATRDRAGHSEARAINVANQILTKHAGRKLNSLSDLLSDGKRLLTTFPELDHYKARTDEKYVGPIRGKSTATLVQWEETTSGRRIFAYLRPDTPNVREILKALETSEDSVICVTPGIRQSQMKPRVGFIHSEHPLNLDPILANADLCVSYAAEGTVMESLLKGTPQLMFPRLVESFMTAWRVAEGEIGMIENATSHALISDAIESEMGNSKHRQRARAFQVAHISQSHNASLNEVLDAISN